MMKDNCRDSKLYWMKPIPFIHSTPFLLLWCISLIFLVNVSILVTQAQEVEDPSKPDQYDSFMLDDTPATLNVVTATEKQLHNFHKQNDLDWIKINVDTQAPYTFTVTNIGSSCDPKILLHEWVVTAYHVGIQLLQEVDNSPAGGGEKETLSATLQPGSYYLLIQDMSTEPLFVPADTVYELEIARNAADEGSITTFPTLYSIIDQRGGTVPAINGDNGASGVLQPDAIAYYDKIQLTAEPDTFFFPTKVLLSGPEDLDASPDNVVTAQWRMGERKDSASIVHVRVYQETETFDPPLRLRLQLLNNVLIDNWFVVDDIPEGRRVEDAEIWTWNGAAWVLFDASPVVEGSTAETRKIRRLRLQAHSEQSYVEGYFAVFPRQGGTGVTTWNLY